MNGQDWTEVVGAIGVFALITTVITVTIVQLSTSWRAKAALSRESEYRTLAEDAVKAQQATEQRLTDLATRMGEVQARIASIEQVLKQVE